ncbi:MAG TPA: hypothetical protein VKJ47_22415 [Candidatus Binatia bacterium]|nr:hypothetical protein [Candidatus Binatia bacterium]
MARRGISVTGIDVDRERIAALDAGTSSISDAPGEILRALLAVGKVKATESLAVVQFVFSVSPLRGPGQWCRGRGAASSASTN